MISMLSDCFAKELILVILFELIEHQFAYLDPTSINY